MNTLAKWNPFRQLDEIQNQFNSFLGRTPLRTRGETFTVPEWAPPVDVTEDDQEYLITAELPDMKKEDVKVSVQDGAICISGERKREKEEKDLRFHRIERAYGSFARSFSVPEGARPEALSAEYKNGLLTVHLPKSEKAKAKQIEVKVQ